MCQRRPGVHLGGAAAHRDADHARAGGLGTRQRAVAAASVGDEHLVGARGQRALDRASDLGLFVQRRARSRTVPRVLRRAPPARPRDRRHRRRRTGSRRDRCASRCRPSDASVLSSSSALPQGRPSKRAGNARSAARGRHRDDPVAAVARRTEHDVGVLEECRARTRHGSPSRRGNQTRRRPMRVRRPGTPAAAAARSRVPRSPSGWRRYRGTGPSQPRRARGYPPSHHTSARARPRSWRAASSRAVSVARSRCTAVAASSPISLASRVFTFPGTGYRASMLTRGTPPRCTDEPGDEDAP